MATISTAVGLERVSRVVGYQVKKGNFQNVTPNLPMRIAIIGEANTADQGTFPTAPTELTSAAEAGQKYGYGSPIHSIMRILRPQTGDGVGGIPTVVYAQAEAGGAVAAERTITVTGAVTENATHTVKINGRDNLDGALYSFTVLTTDTPTTIAAKISDTINGVLGAPATASSLAGVVTITSKWAGLTSEQLSIEVDVDGVDAGISYAVASTATGAGTPSLASLDFGNEWSTIVINSYDEAAHATLETINGTQEAGTGRYSATVFKPFVAIWGSKLSNKDTLTAITDAAGRKSQVTNVLAPAPNSNGATYEASANVAYLLSIQGQNEPHLTINAKTYPDMPVPSDLGIGDFEDYTNRDFMVKRGASTVTINSGAYSVEDLVTTYHPDGENVPAYRYVRSLVQDWNVYYGYFLLEEINVVDKAIAENDQLIGVANVIKPKQWKGVLTQYAENLAERALIVEPSFMQDSIEVQTGETNPDRLETSFSYKRSPIVRISSTTATAGFAFGLRA